MIIYFILIAKPLFFVDDVRRIYILIKWLWLEVLNIADKSQDRQI